MTLIDTYNLLVCQDCLMIIANDDASGMDDETEDRVRDGIKDWAEEGIQLVPGDSENDHDFSWQPCECCNSPLGGSRHAVVGLQS